jgi:hypothetical protein
MAGTIEPAAVVLSREEGTPEIAKDEDVASASTAAAAYRLVVVAALVEALVTTS